MKRILFSLALCAGLMPALQAAASEVVIDLASDGADYDSILDGFPSLASFDGTGDFGGNALGVALQTGVTEERAILELPLGAIAGADVENATLTFNIDDVVATFGPGTGFDGKASDNIKIFVFAGDGEVTTADFAKTGLSPVATVSTTSFGNITDATLGVSGPLFFDVDVTSAVQAAVDSETVFLGILFATSDNLSATSIDNLGATASGPPGIGGSMLPYLTVTIADPATTTTTSMSTTSTSMEPDAECGDASGDGKISAGDALVILRVAVGQTTCPLAVCDADGNAKITAADAMRVLRVSVGGNSTLYCKS